MKGDIMSEDGDFTPAHWSGKDHDFDTARKVYDDHVGRSYSDAKADKKKARDLIPKSLTTNSPSPLVIISDVTGSMGEWPKTMFSKLPYLELEGQEYLGKDMEICFAAIGDAQNNDDYPLQVRPFTKGTDLKKRLEELIIEGGGGANVHETYELAALYFARNVSMPKAINPIIIFIGDEALYDFINKEDAENYTYTKLEKRISSIEVFEELKRKFEVYLIRKPYHSGIGDSRSSDDEEIYKHWRKVLDIDHICDLSEPGRVVDVIFGILAKETGRIDYFKGEIEGRQTKDQVKTVYKSLATIHRLPAPKTKKHTGKSIMDTGDGPKAKKLI